MPISIPGRNAKMSFMDDEILMHSGRLRPMAVRDPWMEAG